MNYSQELTYDMYSLPETFIIDDIDKIVDGIVAEYLVYKCSNCGTVEKYTFRELEKKERKKISDLVINAVAKGELEKSATLFQKRAKVLIYCGKCNGLDGKGSCIKDQYDKCKLKRLPSV